MGTEVQPKTLRTNVFLLIVGIEEANGFGGAHILSSTGGEDLGTRTTDELPPSSFGDGGRG
jgi:hypothetical protein